jgi:hypothetical protein
MSRSLCGVTNPFGDSRALFGGFHVFTALQFVRPAMDTLRHFAEDQRL